MDQSVLQRARTDEGNRLHRSPGEINSARIAGVVGVSLFLTVCLLTVWLGASRAGNESAFFRYLAACLSFVAVAWIGYSWASFSSRSRLDPFELSAWFTLWAAASIMPFGFSTFSQSASYIVPGFDPEWVADGLWLVVASTAALWAGYRVTHFFLQGALSNKKIQFAMRSASPLRLILCYLLILAGRLWTLRTRGVGFGMESAADSVSQGLGYLGDASSLIVAITAWKVFTRQWARPYLYAVLLIELALIYIGGFMKPALWLFIIVLCLASYAGAKILTVRNVLLLVLFAVVGGTLIPVTQVLRLSIRSNAVDTKSVLSMSSGVMDAFQNSWGQGWDTGWDILESKILERQSIVCQTLGVVVNVTPDPLPFWGVKRLLMIPAYVIPRALWKDKPNLSFGVKFGIDYLGAAPDSDSSAAYTIYGDLYLSFGWPAVVVGMFLLGIVFAVMYCYLVVLPRRHGCYTFFPLYIALAVYMMDLENSYISELVGLIHRLVIFGAFFLIICPRSRGANATGAR